MALFDEIQQRLRTQGTAPQVAGTTSQTQAAQDLLQAKTGRADTSGGPRASNIEEQATEGQTAAKLGQVRAQNTAAAEGLATQQAGLESQKALGQQSLEAQRTAATGGMATEAALRGGARETSAAQFGTFQAAQARMQTQKVAAAYQNKVDELATQAGLAKDDLFQQFKQSNEDLAQRKDAAALEQAAHVLAMSDKAYVDTLNRVGEERRLNDEGNWRNETQDLILGEQLKLTLGKLGFLDKFDADQRTWNETLGQIEPDAALSIAHTQAVSESTKEAWQGIEKLLGAGASSQRGKGGGSSESDLSTGSTGDLRSSEGERY